MKSLENKKTIFWDFDGVIMNSMPVRNRGFELVLKDYPEEEVEELMKFHLKNGGLSRYVKFRYFFEEIRNERILEDQVSVWASKFSKVMRKELVNPTLLIDDSLDFIKKKKDFYDMHVVSGSDEKELRYLCEEMDLARYFISINGSPTPKKQLVKQLLEKFNYSSSDCVLIGDSVNDYEAAVENEIDFFGYNNPELSKLGAGYIKTFPNE